jgi:hypothetical protein
VTEADCTWLRGSSDAEFGADVAAGDLDGDGVGDLLVSARSSTLDDYGNDPRVYRIAGPLAADADVDALGAPEWDAYGAFAPSLPVLADLDADGRLDAVVLTADDRLTQVSVLDADLDAVAWMFEVRDVRHASAADLDGDGDGELLLGGTDEAWVHPGPFEGTLDLDDALVHLRAPADAAWLDVHAMDRDDDGDLDWVVGQREGAYGRAHAVWLIDAPL